MSNGLSELYQEVILDHNRYPRNHHPMENPTTQAEGYNPLCGDRVTVYLHIEANRIVQVSFVGCGCAISQASASLMTELLTDKSVEEALVLFHQFQELVTSDIVSIQALDKLNVLAGVKAYPARVKCATLAWHAFEAAIQHTSQPVTTE